MHTVRGVQTMTTGRKKYERRTYGIDLDVVCHRRHGDRQRGLRSRNMSVGAVRPGPDPRLESCLAIGHETGRGAVV